MYKLNQMYSLSSGLIPGSCAHSLHTSVSVTYTSMANNKAKSANSLHNLLFFCLIFLCVIIYTFAMKQGYIRILYYTVAPKIFFLLLRGWGEEGGEETAAYWSVYIF